jgi:hypothetical protein
MFKKPRKDWGVCDDEPVVLSELRCISPNVPARNVMGSQPTRGVAAATSTECVRAVVSGWAHTVRPCPDQKHTTKICIFGSKQIQRRASLHQGTLTTKLAKTRNRVLLRVEQSWLALDALLPRGHLCSWRLLVSAPVEQEMRDSVADAYRWAAKQRVAEKRGPHLFMRNDILQRALGLFKPKVRPVLHVD